MDSQTMMRRVMARSGLADPDEADRAIRAVLFALADTVSHDEVHDMASQLPKEYKDLVMGRLGERRPVQPMAWGDLVSRVQSEMGLETREAAEHVTRSVFAILKDAVSPGEIEDVLQELPLDLRETMRSA
ncbi:MAG: DUF2267 domain-containing protein [Anaerolineae bacterium]|nr:DUF2267 domain-containing protein [Anaerolineae bacterium]